MSKVIQYQKEILWCIKFFNCLIEYPTLKNDVSPKAYFKAFIDFKKDEISEAIEKIKEINRKYKRMDEPLDENQREIKNNFVEIRRKLSLFLRKINKYEEGENQKKLKDEIIAIFQAVFNFE